MRVQGLGFWIQGLGFGVWDLGFRVWGLAFENQGSGIKVRVEKVLGRVKSFPERPAHLVCSWLNTVGFVPGLGRDRAGLVPENAGID